ncbi:MAG TPA: hypothetical protein VGH82_12675 [Gaiellaceae bacterium]|jgi:hypothetical protein
MRDWKVERLRYVVHFSDGGSGMRYRNGPLAEGDELRDGPDRYVVERVEKAPNPKTLGKAWAQLEA